jgi:Ran GTPase-activating protein (RanGAP) involved in mRNA processing and transport
MKEIQPPFPFISSSPSILPITLSYQNKKLEDIIQKCHTGSEVNLNEQNLTDRDMEIVVQEAIIHKQCKKLLLENNEITSEGALIIANALNSNNNLQELMLFHNHLTDVGVKHLSNALSMNNVTLKTLGLGSNHITDTGIRHLAQMIRTNQSLIVLGLVFNEITDEGVRFLADAISHCNTNLQILHLSKNKFITDGSVNTLIELFKRNHSLRELWMQNCALSGNGKQKLKQMIRSKTNFRLEF